MTTAASARRGLRALRSPAKAAVLARFFKTGKGEYAEGDRFLGVMVPEIRVVARRYAVMAPAQLRSLLRSRFHEDRLCALVIL